MRFKIICNWLDSNHITPLIKCLNLSNRLYYSNKNRLIDKNFLKTRFELCAKLRHSSHLFRFHLVEKAKTARKFDLCLWSLSRYLVISQEREQKGWLCLVYLLIIWKV